MNNVILIIKIKKKKNIYLKKIKILLNIYNLLYKLK